MNWVFLLSAIQNIAIPEITALIASHVQTTGTMPTADQVTAMWQAKVAADVKSVVAQGQAFLDATRSPTA